MISCYLYILHFSWLVNSTLIFKILSIIDQFTITCQNIYKNLLPHKRRQHSPNIIWYITSPSSNEFCSCVVFVLIRLVYFIRKEILTSDAFSHFATSKTANHFFLDVYLLLCSGIVNYCQLMNCVIIIH